MTPREIYVIQRSFAELRSIPDRVGARFYARLFHLAPETRAMFPPDIAAQSRKLIETLVVVVDALDQFAMVLPTLRDLAIRHVDYGVTPEHYGLVGLTLIETLRDLLGPAFDGEVEQAWRDAYRAIAATMVDAALEHTAARPAA